MSLRDLLRTDISEVFLDTEEFADTVRRYRDGDLTNGVDFAGIVSVLGSDTSEHIGRGTIFRASLMCSASADIRVKDRLRHNGFDYEIETVSDPEHGCKTASMIRYASEFRGAKLLRNGDL
jgi:hypothetical protein